MRRPLRSAVMGMVALAIVIAFRSMSPEVAPAPADPPAGQPVPAVALASVESPDASLRLDVLELSLVSPDVLEVRFALTNVHPSQALALDDMLAEHPGEAGSVSAAFVVSDTRQAKYFVVRDSAGKPACSDDIRQLAAGERREGWARFSAPGGPGTRITLQMKGFPPAPGLAIPGRT